MNILQFVSIMILPCIIYACKTPSTKTNSIIKVDIPNAPCLEREIVKFNAYLIINQMIALKNTYNNERLSTGNWDQMDYCLPINLTI